MIVDRSWTRPEDQFVQIHLDLVAGVGWTHAAIITRLAFRTEARSKEAVIVDDILWWRASLEDLGKELHLTKSQVQRAVADLVKDGTIVREKHRFDGQYDQTYSYRINYGEPSTSAESPKLQNRNIDVSETHHVDVANSQHLPLVKKLKEQPPSPPGGEVTDSTTVEAASPLFEQFWQAYPKHVERDDARQVWFSRTRGSGGASPSEIIASAQAWAAHWERAGTDPKFIKSPGNWLRRGCYNDPAPTAALAPAGPYRILT